MHRVLFVIPNYSAKQKDNVELLVSLVSNSGFEPLIVCNSQDSLESFSNLSCATTQLTNLGFGGSINFATRNREFDAIVACNDDLVFGHDSFNGLIQAVESCLKISSSIVGIISNGDELSPKLPSPVDVFSLLSGLRAFCKRFRTAIRAAGFKKATTVQNELVDLSAAGDFFGFSCVVMDKHAWQKMGGFRPEFPLYFEDSDYLYRARFRGDIFIGAVHTTSVHRPSTTSRELQEIVLPLSCYGARNYLKLDLGLTAPIANLVVTSAIIARVALLVPLLKDRRNHLLGCVNSLRIWKSSYTPQLPSWCFKTNNSPTDN